MLFLYRWKSGKISFTEQYKPNNFIIFSLNTQIYSSCRSLQRKYENPPDKHDLPSHIRFAYCTDKEHKFRRLVWILMVGASVGFLFQKLHQSTSKYFSYPFNTKNTIKVLRFWRRKKSQISK